MMQFGFQYLGFGEMIASADAPNAASLRVMENTGMKFLKRENKNGLDTIFYAITKNDFQFNKSIHVIANEIDEQK